jgi:hypothetical protein
MKIQDLSEAIDHLEKAMYILRQFRWGDSRPDNAFRDAYMSIDHQVDLLRNELHYAELQKLAIWRAFQVK